MRFFMIDWFVITCYFVCATKVQQKKHIRKRQCFFLFSGRAKLYCLLDAALLFSGKTNKIGSLFRGSPFSYVMLLLIT